MHALVYTDTCQLTLQEVETPIATDTEMLVKVHASGICGSDMHAWLGHDERRKPPLILGHEVAGEVCQSPNNPARHSEWIGKRVTMNPFMVCGQCRYCKDGRTNICQNRGAIGMTQPGGFAQYLTIPSACLIEIPDTMSYLTASLTEPVAVCVHGVELAVKHHPMAFDQPILIIGAGPIGLITALILQSQGYNQITLCDTNDLRLQTSAEDFHGTCINNRQQSLPSSHFEWVFDCVGSPITRNISVDCATPGSCIIHLGLQQSGGDFNARKLTIDEIAFIGAFTYTHQDLIQALQLLDQQQLGQLNWQKTIALSEGQQACETIQSGNTPVAKYTLLPEKM